MEYIFLDGHYLPMEIPTSMELTKKMLLNNPIYEMNSKINEFAVESTKSAHNFGHITKLSN
jgi:hypothetical protein